MRQPVEARRAYTWESVPWTLIFNSGPPHQGYFEQWNSYTVADTTLELFTGGVPNSTNDVTLQLNVWAYDHVRQRWLAWHEIKVCGRELDTNNNAYFLWSDNLRTNLSFTFTRWAPWGRAA